MKLQLGPRSSILAAIPQNIESLVASVNQLAPLPQPLRKEDIEFYYQDSEGEDIVVSEDEDLFDVNEFAKAKASRDFNIQVKVKNSLVASLLLDPPQPKPVEPPVKAVIAKPPPRRAPETKVKQADQIPKYL